jgi:hypothetical protein
MVLMLQLTLGLRPLATQQVHAQGMTKSDVANAPSEHHPQVHSADHTQDHSPDRTQDDRDPHGSSSSHDHWTGCHATPCCAPTVLRGMPAVPHAVLVISFAPPSSLPVARAYSVASDHRQPPSTPPPASRA